MNIQNAAVIKANEEVSVVPSVKPRTFVVELSALIITVLVLIASLAWNEAANTVFDTFYPGRKGILPFILYALLITILAIVASVILFRYTRAGLQVEEKRHADGRQQRVIATLDPQAMQFLSRLAPFANRAFN